MCYDFKIGVDLNDFFEGGVGGVNFLYEIEVFIYVWSDVVIVILFVLVEFYKFFINFYCILVVLVSVSFSGVFNYLILVFWKVWWIIFYYVYEIWNKIGVS